MIVANAEGLEGSSCSTSWPCTTRAAAANRRAKTAMTGGSGFNSPLNLLLQTEFNSKLLRPTQGFVYRFQSDVAGSTPRLC